MKASFVCAALLLTSLPWLAPAQEEGEAPKATTQPCSSAPYRQFDFWIGDWEVTAGDQFAGSNTVEVILNGCALRETWRGAGQPGLIGNSINMYDHANDRWHQTWIDNSGTLIELKGGLQGREMVFNGQRPSPGGDHMIKYRITWTPNRDGSVRQLWEASSDGTNWTVLFDGHYRRSSATQ